MLVIVADDERFVREGIVKSISWRKYHIDTVLEAKNGTECLELAAKNPPDILIADIRMPRLNGIEVAKEIAKMYPGCKIIMISAYSDKIYLRSAISLNVVAYVDKPVVISQLEEALEKSVRIIKEHESIQDKNATYSYFESILLNGPANREHVSGTPGKTRISGKYAVVLIYSQNASLKYRYLEESLTKEFRKYEIQFFIYQDIVPLAWVVVLYTSEDVTYDTFITGVRDMIGHMENNYFTSIGKIVNSPVQLAESLLFAKSGSAFLFQKGYGEVVYVKRIIQQEEYEIDQDKLDEFINVFASGNGEKAIAFLEELFSEIEMGNQVFSKNSIKHEMGKLLSKILELISGYSAPQPQVWENFFACNTLPDIKEYIQKIIEAVTLDNETQDVLVKKMRMLIAAEYYNPNLSITFICERLGVSKTRMCSLFKESTGKTINEYITEYRVNKAKQYLYQDYPLDEVAKLVGFSDSSYFSKIFKKITGLTPSSYRKHG